MFGKRRVYLDAAAGALGNPSSPHEEGRWAKGMLEEARTSIARLIEVQSDDVVFTSGATESNALAILGHVRARRTQAGPDAVGRNNIHVLYLPSAHASIVENVRLLAEEGIQIEALPIRDWRVDTDALVKMLRPETALVTMEAVCGETGVVWNTREVAHVLQTHVGRTTSHIRLHVDASQAPQTEKLTRAHFNADLLTLDGAKVGVRGVGALVAHRTIPITPLYRGGGQERGLCPGSEVPEAAEKFAAALRAAAHERETVVARVAQERALLLSVLTKIPQVVVNAGKHNVPHIVNVSLLGRDTDYLVALLDEAGFAVATRSACETDSTEGSRAVYALSGDSERARSTLRISWGGDVSGRDLRRFCAACVRAVAFIDTHAAR